MLARAVATMVALNADASRAAVEAGAHAMTDVTGFGLAGHLHHLCRESGLAAEVEAAAVPALDGVEALLTDHGSEVPGRSGGSRRNGEWASAFTSLGDDVPAWRRRLTVDATTSGGLLVALPPDAADTFPGSVMGRLVDGPAGTIAVR